MNISKKKHDSTETLTTRRVISSMTNSPPAELSTQW